MTGLNQRWSKKKKFTVASATSQSQRSCYETDTIFSHGRNKYQEDEEDLFKFNLPDMQLDDKISLQVVALSDDLPTEEELEKISD